MRTVLTTEEFNPYYSQYINKVAPDLDLVTALENSQQATQAFYSALPNDMETYRYEEGKWTPKEVLQHLMDTERVFSYRALRFARNDKTALVGFEQDDFVLHSDANDRTLDSLLTEYNAVREATISFYSGLTDEVLPKVGTASGSNLSVRAAGFITAGHDLHHIQIIQERYL